MEAKTTRPHSILEDPSAMTVADTYAQAVLALCPTDEQAEQFYQETNDLLSLSDEFPEYTSLLTASLLSVKQKAALVNHTFNGRVSDTMMGLLGTLAHHNRLGLLHPVRQRFRALLDQRQGKVTVTVTTAVPMDDQQRQQISDALAQAVNTKVILETQVDEDLLGGMVVRVGDRVVDASIKADLDRLKRRLIVKRVTMTDNGNGR